MTEKEKMLAGQRYNAREPELMAMYRKARRLLDSFNGLPVEAEEEKRAVLGELFGSAGENLWIEKPFFCDYGENIRIGEDSFINFNCTFLDVNAITIGKNALIGPNVQIYTAMHPLDAAERFRPTDNPAESPYTTFAKPVTIGDNVWIGGNAVILPGVTIGDNVVIGAGSVVTRSIPSDSIAVGNPARLVTNV